MKKIMSVIICLVLIVSALPLTEIPVRAEKAGKYTYTVSNGEATITDAEYSISGKVTIPSKLDGYPVTGIGDYAFEYCDLITSIVIGNNVTNIGEGAFFVCSSLKSVTIEDSVRSIGSWAFENCDSLKSVAIGGGVTFIGSGAFLECFSLTNITVDADNNSYCDIDGVLFNKDKTDLISYPLGRKEATYIIPDGVTSVGEYGFSSCESLTSITIPDSVTSIGYSAFEGCTSLISIIIPDSVIFIDDYAFNYCPSLAKVIIGDGVTSIGYYAFEYCESITSVTIGKSVTNIYDGAFADCDSLKRVYYRGSSSDENNISIESYNWDLIGADWYYNSCIGFAEHIYDNDCDAQCNDCEYIRPDAGHIYDNNCDSVCNKCQKSRLTSHQYDGDEDYICNECFYERPPYAIGDISGDGSVNTTDLAVMKLFLAGAGEIDNTGSLAGDMTRDGQINTTDLAQLKLFLAGDDGSDSEVLRSEYTTQRIDKSYKNKKGQVLIEHYYDLVQLKGNSEAVEKINSALKAETDSFFLSDEELKEYGEYANVKYPYCYTMDATVSHNAGGYICIVTSYDWYMGGVANDGYYGFTYNLSTGQLASLAELTDKTRISLENEIKAKVIEYFDDEQGYDAVYETKDYELNDFEFFIENGEIVIVIPEYEIIPDTVTINTGIYVK